MSFLVGLYAWNDKISADTLATFLQLLHLELIAPHFWTSSRCGHPFRRTCSRLKWVLLVLSACSGRGQWEWGLVLFHLLSQASLVSHSPHFLQASFFWTGRVSPVAATSVAGSWRHTLRLFGHGSFRPLMSQSRWISQVLGGFRYVSIGSSALCPRDQNRPVSNSP